MTVMDNVTTADPTLAGAWDVPGHCSQASAATMNSPPAAMPGHSCARWRTSRPPAFARANLGSAGRAVGVDVLRQTHRRSDASYVGACRVPETSAFDRGRRSLRPHTRSSRALWREQATFANRDMEKKSEDSIRHAALQTAHPTA